MRCVSRSASRFAPEIRSGDLSMFCPYVSISPASMKIVAVTNIKGGVGKTTTAVNLAYLCAASGQRTLLWDLDPQAAATYILRCETAGKGVGQETGLRQTRTQRARCRQRVRQVGRSAGGFFIPPFRRASQRAQESHRTAAAHEPQSARTLRRVVSRLPVRHLAAVGERAARRRRRHRPTDSEPPVGPHAGTAARFPGCQCLGGYDPAAILSRWSIGARGCTTSSSRARAGSFRAC